MAFENLDILKEAGSVNQAIIKEIKGVVVENTVTIELVSAINNPDINHASAINFIEIIREDAPPPMIANDKTRLNTSQIQNLLALAKEELDQKEFDKSLDKYQIVLNNLTSSKKYKIEALEGMRAIGSINSLLSIKKYLQKLNPIMWDYKEPDDELINASINVYLAIAHNLGQVEKEKAINMLNRSFSFTRNPEPRYLAIQSLKDLGTLPGKEFEENNFVDHSGYGKQVKLEFTDNTSQFTGEEEIVLTNGIKGTKNSDAGDWQKIPENDLIATIDLNETMDIGKISVNFLHNIDYRIFVPSQVEFSISDDGKNFKVLSIHKDETSQRQEDAFIKDFTSTFERTKTRYVRIKAKNIGICPSWHTNHGEQAWLFCDEVQIY
jgi:hypothetical protein